MKNLVLNRMILPLCIIVLLSVKSFGQVVVESMITSSFTMFLKIIYSSG
jgi:hypothetical protein